MTERGGVGGEGGADKHCHFHVMRAILQDGDLRTSFPYSYHTSWHDATWPEIKHELGLASNGQTADCL